MDYIKKLSQKARAQSVENIVQKEYLNKESWIRTTIRDRWKIGRQPNGDLIGFYASESYALDKNKSNSLAGFGNVDLVLTGSLWKGIQIDFTSQTQAEVFSTDEKFDDISEKYGDWNFNLSVKEKEWLDEMVFNDGLMKILKNTYE